MKRRVCVWVGGRGDPDVLNKIFDIMYRFSATNEEIRDGFNCMCISVFQDKFLGL